LPTHVLAEAGELQQLLVNLGLADEGSFTNPGIDQPLLGQFQQGLADSHAADVVLFGQLALRGESVVGGVVAVFDLGSQDLFKLDIEGGRDPVRGAYLLPNRVDRNGLDHSRHLIPEMVSVKREFEKLDGYSFCDKISLTCQKLALL